MSFRPFVSASGVFVILDGPCGENFSWWSGCFHSMALLHRNTGTTKWQTCPSSWPRTSFDLQMSGSIICITSGPPGLDAGGAQAHLIRNTADAECRHIQKHVVLRSHLKSLLEYSQYEYSTVLYPYPYLLLGALQRLQSLSCLLHLSAHRPVKTLRCLKIVSDFQVPADFACSGTSVCIRDRGAN